MRSFAARSRWELTDVDVGKIGSLRSDDLSGGESLLPLLRVKRVLVVLRESKKSEVG